MNLKNQMKCIKYDCKPGKRFQKIEYFAFKSADKNFVYYKGEQDLE
jgi:hypothetical protein